jgi:hypothetical protein
VHATTGRASASPRPSRSRRAWDTARYYPGGSM